MSGFQKFLLRGNVVDLAVAVIIATAFVGVINALVKDIITPIIGMFGGTPDFSSFVITIRGSNFLIGDFINAVVAFIVIAAVVYYAVVIPATSLMERVRPEQTVSPNTRVCPECLSKIPIAARRCAFCTVEVSPEASSGVV